MSADQHRARRTQSNPEQRKRTWILCLVAVHGFVLSTASVTLAGTWIPVVGTIDDWAITASGLLLIVGIGSVWIFHKTWLRIIFRVAEYESPAVTKPTAIFGEKIDIAIDRLYEKLTPAQVAAMTAATIASWSYVDRTTETVELMDHRIRRRLTRRLVPPEEIIPTAGEERGKWLFPVLRHRKEDLIDEIEVTISGKSIGTVGHITNVAAACVVVEQLFWQAFPERTKAEFELLRAILGVVAHPSPIASTREYTTKDGERRLYKPTVYKALYERIRNLAGGRPTTEQTLLLRAVEYLANNYYIFSELPITPQREVIALQCAYSEMRFGRPKGIPRRLGIPLYRYLVPIPEALNSPSYHLRCFAPEQTYLQEATWWVQPESEREIAESYRFAPTFGSDHVHFYARGLDVDNPVSSGSAVRRVLLDLEFKVTPPGTSLGVMALSIYLALIVTVLSLLHDKVFGDPPTGSSMGLPLILAIPTVMSAWLISRFDNNGLRTSSPVVLLQLLTLLLLSTATVAASIFKQGNARSDDVPVLNWIPFEHPTWATLWILCLAHMVVSIYAHELRTAAHRSAKERSAERKVTMRNKPAPPGGDEFDRLAYGDAGGFDFPRVKLDRDFNRKTATQVSWVRELRACHAASGQTESTLQAESTLQKALGLLSDEDVCPADADSKINELIGCAIAEAATVGDT